MDLNGMRVKELNDMCKKFGIKTGGRKAEIIERIEASAAYKREIKANGRQAGKRVPSPSNNKRGASTDIDVLSNSTKKLKHQKQEIHVAINSLFDQFQDPEEPDAMTDDGIMALCTQLGIDAQDPVILVLSWYMEAEAMCIYTRREFERGLEKLQCRTVEDVKRSLPKLRAMLKNRADFTDIYLYTFTYAKDPTQKSLALDIALGLWELLLPGYFPLLHHWLRFVKTNCHNSISKDVWMQVLEFGHQVKRDLSNFDENGAWPVLIDEFVSHMQESIAERGLEKVLKEEDDGDTVMEDA